MVEGKIQKVLLKKELNNFIENLMKDYEVIAPVHEGNTKFKIIKNIKEIFLKNITKIPVKKFFLPDDETLLKFKNGNIVEPKDQTLKRIIFGLRLCDLNALLVLDKVMIDPLYINKRKKTILIGLYCDDPDEYCFCNSMELEDYYDLFFYPRGDKYYISIGSKKGRMLIKDLTDAKEIFTPKIKNTKTLKKKDISGYYRNDIWKSDADKCLSCGACTVYCPTCNCFDIKDDLAINLKDGKRIRTETSCQLRSFSRVAGGKIFRESRLSRFKHFVYHKIVYFKKQHNKYMCVGCGRCLRVCPTKIDWVNTINTLYDAEALKK